MAIPDAGGGGGTAEVLSRSQLFALQRAFYESAGLTAWSQGTVPSQVTTNPVIAGAYARIIFGYLRDLWQQRTLDRSRPIHVLDLGAGTGRLAYLVHKQLTALCESGLLPPLQLRFVLTDLGDANQAAHARNPQLQPLLQQGALDCAALTPEHLDAPPSLHLLSSGTVLTPENLGNPLIVLANYFFDSIPHDAFRVRGGALEECQVAVGRPVAALPERLSLRLSYKPLDPLRPATGYYPEARWNELLCTYARRLPDTHVLFPVGPLRYLRWLSGLAGGQLLVLAADKGYDHLEQIRGYQNLALAQHGAFSLPVNFHALTELAGADGFAVLRGPRRESQLKIIGLVRGAGDHARDESAPDSGAGTASTARAVARVDPRRGWPETALAFSEQIARAHPSDCHRILKQAVMPAMEQPLAYLLSLLRLSQHDPWLVLTYREVLVQEAAQAPPTLGPELVADLAKVWENYFSAVDPRDLRRAIADILSSAGCVREAAAYAAPTHSLSGQIEEPSTQPPQPPKPTPAS